MRRTTLVIAAVVVTGCNGRSAAPTAPSPASMPVLAIVRGVTVDRTSVEAGSEVVIVASLDASIAPGRYRFVWTVTPPGGSLTSDGATARWRSPATDPVPTSYVFSVAAMESAAAVTSGSAASTTNAGGATSPPVTVNDARRETQAHATSFLSDLANVSVSPEFCVRNFTDACGGGKRAALDEAASLRAQYSAATTSYSLQLFLRSVEWANCIGPDGGATCALLVYTVDTEGTRRSDGGRDHTHGYQYLRAVYERNRWSLCSSRFADDPTAIR